MRARMGAVLVATSGIMHAVSFRHVPLGMLSVITESAVVVIYAAGVLHLPLHGGARAARSTD